MKVIEALFAHNKEDIKVAVIGAGAAGLVVTRVLARNGIEPIVLEKDSAPAGVWRYEKNSKKRPMYRGLRTNLPKEIMAYREKPWGNNLVDRSFVTHKDVYEYLNGYTTEFNLERFISYNSKVTQLAVERNEISNAFPASSDEVAWPKISLCWEEQIDGIDSNVTKQCRDKFDAVCVCNGHFSVPLLPSISGLDFFKGQVMHAIEYDDPSYFEGKNVLCVGGRASGSDLTREISSYAKKVYLSDSSCPKLTNGEPHHVAGNITWVPRTLSIDSTSAVHFADSCAVSPKDIDVIVLCSGYDYAFPFINEESNLDLSVVPGERRVSPLYEQLWHADYPNVAFVGLPHSIVPFPFFELQAEAIVAQLTGKAPITLLPTSARLDAAKADAASGGPNNPGRVQDTHYLGSFQWDFLRKYAKMAGLYSRSMEDFIATSQAIYDHSRNERTRFLPGGPDIYRSTRYVRDDATRSFQVVPSKVSGTESIS